MVVEEDLRRRLALLVQRVWLEKVHTGPVVRSGLAGATVCTLHGVPCLGAAAKKAGAKGTTQLGAGHTYIGGIMSWRWVEIHLLLKGESPRGFQDPGPSSDGTVARSIEGSPRGLSSPLAGGGPLLLMESIEPDFFGPASRSSSRLWVPVKRISRLNRRAEASEIRE